MSPLQDWGDHFQKSLEALGGGNPAFTPALLVTLLTVLALAVSITLKFLEQSAPAQSLVRNCSVTTLTMSLVFVAFVPLVRYRLGAHEMAGFTGWLYFGTGALAALGSTAFNLWARSHIGAFWSDHIVIRPGHRIVKDGPFAYSRHPMYGSLVLYGVGLAMMFQNIALLGATLLVFLPMMFYRARLEEKQLEQLGDQDYGPYRKATPLLLPRLEHRLELALRWLGSALFAAVLIRHQYSLEEIFFVSLYFEVLAGMVREPKVWFSYGLKGIVLLGVYVFSLFALHGYYFYYLFFAFSVIGMKYNCPAMSFYVMLHPPKEEENVRLR